MTERNYVASAGLALVTAIRARRLSARAVTEAALARVASRGAAVNAFTAVLRDQALADADRVDQALTAGRDPGPLAGLPFDDGASPGQVAALLAHFFDRRALAASLFQGSALRILRKTLVGQVEARLRRGGDRLRMPPRLAAHALADGIFSPLLAWLAGESACTAHELAAALSASSRGMRAGLVAASS